MVKINLLVISDRVPFDNVGHAGGKIHNYIIKELLKDKRITLKLITFADEEEKRFIDLQKYNIEAYVFAIEDVKNNILSYFRFIINKLVSLLNYGGLVNIEKKRKIIHKLENLKKEGYKPNVISLEWTQIYLIFTDIKKIFPESKFIAVAHDVSFQSFFRIYYNENNLLAKLYRIIIYLILKKRELLVFKEVETVLVFNKKDKDILTSNKIKENIILHIVPYFDMYSNIKLSFSNYNIIYYGAINRKENYEACIWFIENVFKKLLKINNKFKFYIIGSNPNNLLYKYANSNIIITGYVKNVDLYFKNSLCLVAPLLTGAGIKIKILEAMSAGIPVLTNNIGIEGINARDKIEYFYCKYPNDYIDVILKLKNKQIRIDEVSFASKEFISNNFNYIEGFDRLKNRIIKICEN